VTLALLLAFAGGLLSFASPCVLPLVPAYLSLVTGLGSRQLLTGPARPGVVLRGTAGFVGGFAVVFVVLGSTSSLAGRFALSHHGEAVPLAGGVILALSAFLAGSQLVRQPRLAGRPYGRLYGQLCGWLYGERRAHLEPRLWQVAPPLAGAAFGLGWTPCIGPVLASVLSVAATEGHAASGAALLGAYSLGLGAPLVASGLLLGRCSGIIAFLKRHGQAVTFVSAALLAALGVLLLLGKLPLLYGAGGALV
jgi:cytochrome c-type biogenesis protein